MKTCVNFIFSLFLLLLSHSINSQNIKGKVINEEDKQAVPFAVIVFDRSNNGTTTDIDGNFSLTMKGAEKEITIQVMGYFTKTIPLSDLNLNSNLVIKIKPSAIKLLEVVITPKENPAIPIIKQVIKNKPKYDIANIKYYLCNTYAKTYFTMSDKNGDENFYNKDTSLFKSSKKMLDRSYFFFMESVTEKKYIYKNKSQEKVLSSRVSGFKSAPFGSFASQLQSFTFYTDNTELLGVKYVNPLISGTFKRYKFEIIDTVFTNADTTILIKFYPKKNIKFRAMKGIVYINKNDYALSNVLAEPAEIDKNGTGIKIQQLYEKVDSVHWFPRQVNTEILFNSFNVSSDKSGEGNGSIIKGVSKMYIKEIKLDSVIKIRNKNVISYNAEDFANKDEKFWDKYRIDSLNQKEKRTYALIDSIGKEAKLDQKLKWLNTLRTGKFPMGYLNIDLKHILRFNDYEYARLGLGLSTSNKLTRWMSLGGYGGYGFKDKAFKYGGHLQVNLNYPQTTFLKAEIASDIIETAGTSFLQENQTFISTQKIRDLLVSKMDKINFAKASFNTALFNVVKASLYLQVQQRSSPYGFYNNPSDLSGPHTNNFTLNEAGIQFRYWHKEKFIESLDQVVSAGSKWPVLYLNVTKGLTTKIYDYTGDFDYTKVDLKIDHQINFRIKGYISYQIQAGKVFGDVPYSIQYNNKGSRTDNYYVSAEKTFETMYLNEFVSSEYASLFFSLNFGKVLRKNKYVNPEIELVHNYGIGNINNRASLTFIELNDMSKGYTEAGIRLRNLIKSNISTFGLGVFYRYGNYAYDKVERNLTYKLVLGFAL